MNFAATKQQPDSKISGSIWIDVAIQHFVFYTHRKMPFSELHESHLCPSSLGLLNKTAHILIANIFVEAWLTTYAALLSQCIFVAFKSTGLRHQLFYCQLKATAFEATKSTKHHNILLLVSTAKAQHMVHLKHFFLLVYTLWISIWPY